ncbi:polysaccharide biosynthesis protein [Aequorivita marina]|uniref:polysaccharide biosynthesis protein n=1 Tax=Aequorivita marina TaxID=3073654 RepID=UPI0028762EEC|nr:nucleoside-diphosphate sugar epimerase/dehydratase [Aequorivita sp. S2608]MDS1299053.1 nucleoside-diphosphate sugar epimerase/dehydratase [Aequorivita sp. S2608]
MGRPGKLTLFLTRVYCNFRSNILGQRYLPRWIVALNDLVICALSFLITWFILSETPVFFDQYLSVYQKAITLISIHYLCFFLFRTYSGIIRYSTFSDVYRFAKATITFVVITSVLNMVFYHYTNSKLFLTTTLLLYSFISITLLLGFRIVIKETYRFLRAAASGNLKKRVIVLGTDDKTISLAHAILTDPASGYRPVAFLTTKEKRTSFKLIDLPVCYTDSNLETNLKKFTKRYKASGVLLIGDMLSVEERSWIAEACFSLDVAVYNLSLPEQWNDFSDKPLKIVPLKIEDLLERSVIEIDTDNISNDLKAKKILITGGAGSIGSELVRQIAAFDPEMLVVLDNSESPLHVTEVYLKKNFPELNYRIYLADVTQKERMEGVFKKFNFDVVYHAAAYKHVPMMERHPREAIRTNILGTRNLAELAVKYGCERFVMVSTDKAVNPSNVMGASKRAAEMFVQALQRSPGITTRFITTRFGNVLGSNGSVIPFFRQQIKNGGPVTVTHKDIIRYFMTIEEACQLVLQAGTMGKGGEIFVFDMGEPVRILSLAERMIKLSGFKPYIDIPIEIVGLRQGEKLYEELLIDGESTLPTYHPKIMVCSTVQHDYTVISAAIDELEALANSICKKRDIIIRLKMLVPEFLSQNSEYSKLDR